VFGNFVITLISLWRALWRPTTPASQTKSRRTAEESRTNLDLHIDNDSEGRVRAKLKDKRDDFNFT